jgi:hypothetical protein
MASIAVATEVISSAIWWRYTAPSHVIPLAQLQPWLTGVLDQNAYLQVVRSDGKSSNLWPVSFTAARTAPYGSGLGVSQRCLQPTWLVL